MYRIGISLAVMAALWNSPVQAECLSRPMSYDSGEEVKAEAPLHNLIEVPSEEAASYIAQGYSPASCSADKSPKTLKIDGCTMARFGNEAVQKRFATLLGVEPAKLCASTQKLKGKSGATQTPDKN